MRSMLETRCLMLVLRVAKKVFLAWVGAVAIAERILSYARRATHDARRRGDRKIGIEIALDCSRGYRYFCTVIAVICGDESQSGLQWLLSRVFCC